MNTPLSKPRDTPRNLYMTNLHNLLTSISSSSRQSGTAWNNAKIKARVKHCPRGKAFRKWDKRIQSSAWKAIDSGIKDTLQKLEDTDYILASSFMCGENNRELLPVEKTMWKRLINKEATFYELVSFISSIKLHNPQFNFDASNGILDCRIEVEGKKYKVGINGDRITCTVDSADADADADAGVGVDAGVDAGYGRVEPTQ